MTAVERARHFYVGTYASEEEEGLFHCTLNEKTGELHFVSAMGGIENPSYLTVCPNRTHLYAASEKDYGEVVAYTLDPETFEPHRHGRTASEGAAPCFVSATPNGKILLAANYGGSVSAFSIRAHGVLEQVSCVQHSGSGIHPQRQDSAHPHAFVPSPDGTFLFAPDLGTDRIARYTLEDERLFKQEDIELPAGTGPRTLAFHPDGRWAYISGELNNTVTALEYEPQSGGLTAFQCEALLPAEQAADPANTAAHTAVSPCGKYVYVSNRGDDSITQFAVDLSDGRLSPVERVSSGGRIPRHFAIMGGFLVAANQESGRIVSFAIGAEDGRLTPTGYALELSRPVCICPMPEADSADWTF
ncbi:lactonase family protein [Saccharibacillus deserti]|uniref:lactonase family protein n=1 Tax=Saccharibacillus deserti TaxID=1634444 RepID=UPI001551F85B|nr:lactonase family protein [Saccharibacillus deserti]